MITKAYIKYEHLLNDFHGNPYPFIVVISIKRLIYN